MSPDAQLATDASLEAMGAICDKQYIAAKFPLHIKQLKFTIVHLEMLAILVSLRMWGCKLNRKRFVINCDNMACVEIISSGSTKDHRLQNLMRHVIMECARNNIEIIPRYIKSVENRIPDFLSRLHKGPVFKQKLRQELPMDSKMVAVPMNFFDVTDIW